MGERVGLRAWWRGRDDERAQLIALHREILRVSAEQLQVTARITALFEQLQGMYSVEGPPSGRHINDELEAEILDELTRGTRES